MAGEYSGQPLVPLRLDTQGAGKNAAANVPQDFKPFEIAVEKEMKKINNAIAKMAAAPGKKLGEDGIIGLDKSMTNYANSAKYAAKHITDLARSQNRLVIGKTNIQSLSSQITVLANKWGAMRLESKFDKNGKLRNKAQDLIDKLSRLIAKATQFGQALESSTAHGATAMAKAASSARALKTNYEDFSLLLPKSNMYLGRIVGRMAAFASIAAAGRFVRNIREVTAEFELQRVALGSILQDAGEAEKLFGQIKASALKSPFEIKDLVTYTKQLAAYQIETDKLFDTTKKLADVSAGLGVDMNRLILAYGQVRAASVLRGQELRQFTEAGIPLVEKLAEKFRELGREGTTTADVFELISKRAVPFEMIAEIFDDMTSAGGAFYQMQERQSETLKGQWMKLKDALSIMYDEMGNTPEIHKGMTDLLQTTLSLLRHWRTLARAIKDVAIAFATLKVASQFFPSITRNAQMATRASQAYRKAKQLENLANRTNSVSIMRQADHYRQLNILLRKATRETNMFKQALLRIRIGLMSINWGQIASVAATALITIGSYFIEARREAQRFKSELESVRAGAENSAAAAERNFKRLANAALSSPAGSRERKEALDELKRSYGELIPQELLELSALGEMNGEYESLIRLIKEKIRLQALEQNLSSIQTQYDEKIGKSANVMREALLAQGYSIEEVTRVIEGYGRAIENLPADVTSANLFSYSDEISEALISTMQKQLGVNEAEARYLNSLMSGKYNQGLPKFIENSLKLRDALAAEERAFKAADPALGVYAKRLEEVRKQVSEIQLENNPLSLEGQKEKIEKAAAIWKQAIADVLVGEDAPRQTGVPYDDILMGMGINFAGILNAIKDNPDLVEARKFIEEIQEDYNKLVPNERIPLFVRDTMSKLVEGYSVNMEDLKNYLLKDGQNVDEYVTEIGNTFPKLEKEATRLQNIRENWNPNFKIEAPDPEEIKKLQETAEILKVIFKLLGGEEKTTGGGGGGYREDPMISVYKNRLKFVQDFAKGVKDLNKYLGEQNAILREREIMQGRGGAVGIDVTSMTGSQNEVMDWYRDTIAKIQKEIEKLGGRAWRGLGVHEMIAKSTQSKRLKAWQDLLQDYFRQMTEYETEAIEDNLNKALDKISDRIKRMSIARDFYDKIFDFTGDERLATQLSMEIYGNPGQELRERLDSEIQDSINAFRDAYLDSINLGDFSRKDRDAVKEWIEALKGWTDEGIDKANSITFVSPDTRAKLNKSVAYLNDVFDIMKAIDLDRPVEELMPVLEKLPKFIKDRLSPLVDEYKKFQAEWEYNFLKTYSSAKTFDERLDMNEKRRAKALAEAKKRGKTASELAAVELYYDREASKIELERLKNTYEWTKAFEDLDKVSTQTMRRLISMINEYIRLNPEMPPERLKELTRQRAQLEESLISRDPYGSLAKNFEKMLQARVKALWNPRTVKDYDDINEATADVVKSLDAISSEMSTISSSANDLATVLGLDENDYMKAALDGISKGIGGVTAAINLMKAAMAAAKTEGGWITLLASALASIYFIVKNMRITWLNKQIETQQTKIDALAFSYDRLQDSMSRAFGSDYIRDYQQQLAHLAATQEAYEKQAALERKKGKEADEEKIREYEQNAIETANKIAEAQRGLQEFFAGTDLTSAARDFASAWVEAYKEFGSTTNAMKEKFQEMVESMVQSSLAAQIMQSLLDPIFREIDTRAKDGSLNAQDISEIAALASSTIPQINSAMTNLMNQLAAAGYNMRQKAGSFTGIARNIANASEESITGLAAGVNTQNFYMQNIDKNVAAILSLLGGNPNSEGAAAGGDVEPMSPYQTQVLTNLGSLPQMRDDMAAMRAMLDKVIKPNGVSSTHRVIVG